MLDGWANRYNEGVCLDARANPSMLILSVQGVVMAEAVVVELVAIAARLAVVASCHPGTTRVYALMLGPTCQC